ncbi:hypothetical protein ACO0LO_27075 [Undibacterium sp. TJN25]|uniref:hypothetical protein n=1 Tax=Undibacterium sp. TJN25 TaxID=3413056 RepID=UPI003BF2A47E
MMLDGGGVDPFPHLERWLDTVGQLPETLKAHAMAKSYNKNAVQPSSLRAKALTVFGASRAAPEAPPTSVEIISPQIISAHCCTLK